MNILARHEEERLEKEDQIKAQKRAKADERTKARQEYDAKIEADEAAEAKRMDNWEAREDRQEKAAIRLQAERNLKIEGEERTWQARKERQRELAHDMNQIRKNLWDKHSEKDQKREHEQVAALEAIEKHKQKAREAAMLPKAKKKVRLSY